MRLLKSNDVVDIIAPASRGDAKDFLAIEQFLQGWGLKARIPSLIFGDDYICANSDEMRFQQLKEALFSPDSQAIWCLRGGYGSMKLIPFLQQLTPPSQRKLFIGSSDITALHFFLQREWGWETIHGPSIYSASTDKTAKESLDLLRNLIFKGEEIIFNDLTPLNKQAKKEQSIKAKITGGNLCLIQSSMGTSWEVNAADKIIFMEEINERGYRVDRMFEHLKQARVFDHAKAVLLGDFIGGTEPNGESLIPAVIQHFAEQTPIPVLQVAGIGHGFVNNPLVLGRVIQLNLGSRGQTVLTM